MIRILIVDDSKTELALLKYTFESEHDMQVVGCASNGKDAVSQTALLKPDIITMDIQMPVMDGFEATRIIMSQHPTPIVVISSTVTDKTLQTTFLALEAGALSVIEKPVNIASPNFATARKNIIDTVRSMSEIKVIKRRFNNHTPINKISSKPVLQCPIENYEIVAIGTSVGGPQALKTILSNLPKDFPIPIVVVQHMTQGFITGFSSWLNENTVLTIKNALHYEPLLPGTVYFAPDGCHLEVARINNRLVANLVKGSPISGFCPSATALLRSTAKTCGKKAIGILLTGMGNDGAQGLLELRQAHGHTFIQDEKSAIVFGMAGVAQSLGAADKVVELSAIADYLIRITRHLTK